jgi:AcrR family transcriptional regulator
MDIRKETNMEQSILEVAEILFLEKGFDATSTTQIAKAVGCNQALVHYYYRTKDNLFNTIFETKFKNFFSKVFDISGMNAMSFLDKVKYIVETHYDLLSENPKLPMLILNELSRKKQNIDNLREKLHVYPEKLYAVLNTELQVEIAAGKVRDITFMDMMITIISLNVAMFNIFPVAAELIQLNDEQKINLIKQRRSENVTIVLSYLKPNELKFEN